MAKMFYTLEEAAAKLGKGEADVRKLAENGQLQEFRDRDKLMFKVEQVDILAGGKDDDEMIPLAESGEQDAISLSSSGTNMSLSGPDQKESTGISIFEADATEEADPSAVTRVTPAIGGGGIGLADSGGFAGGSGGSGSGSGSGLMDLTREKDDTSLGADLLEDVYGSNAGGASAGTVEEAAVEAGDGGGLFETSAGAPGVVDTGAAAAAAMPMAALVEVYDGPGSGLVGGAALGGAIALLLGIAAASMRLAGASTDLFAGASPFVLLGALAGVLAVCTLLGWVLGKRG